MNPSKATPTFVVPDWLREAEELPPLSEMPTMRFRRYSLTTRVVTWAAALFFIAALSSASAWFGYWRTSHLKPAQAPIALPAIDASTGTYR